MSYGGSGMIASLVTLSVLLRIDWENRRLERGSRYERQRDADPRCGEAAPPADDGRWYRQAHFPGAGNCAGDTRARLARQLAGTPTGMEQTLVPQDIFRLHSIAFEGIVGRGIQPKLMLPLAAPRVPRG